MNVKKYRLLVSKTGGYKGAVEIQRCFCDKIECMWTWQQNKSYCTLCRAEILIPPFSTCRNFVTS